MQDETYYRHLADNTLPCPTCNKPVDVLKVEVTRTMLADGRERPYCPHCGARISWLELRGYGRDKRNHTLEGLPEPKGKA